MKPLEEYTFKDEQGKDQGINGEGTIACLPLRSHLPIAILEDSSL